MAKLTCRLLACLCMTFLFSSCIFDYPPETGDNDPAVDSNKVVLHVNIQPIAASASGNPTEKIKSLRVVIIGRGTDDATTDTIECNRLLGIPTSLAKDFSYTLMWNSQPGEKDIFVIANEESVSKELTPLLDEYAEQEPAGNFKEFVNSYAFAPVYTPDEQNNIFLPYSYSYEGLVPKTGVVNTINAWLVPVATKFVFNFTNNRPNGINVNGISMKYANQSNYLLARPGEGELVKEYNGKPISWVDWLAEISKNSWAYPDFAGNENFNGEVGWIIDYELPHPEDAEIFTFFEKGEVFTVRGATTTEVNGVETTTPGKYSTPVFYLPESANFNRLDANQGDSDGGESEEGMEQRFFLTMLFEDPDVPNSKPPKFEDIAIPNLKALFRNTYVIIDVTMSEGDIELYAEIANWNVKTANGWVSDRQAPPRKSFKITKKW